MSDIFQKIPPHSLEAEQSLLGSMMLSEDAVDAAKDVLDDISKAVKDVTE